VTTSVGGSYSNFNWKDDHTITYTLTAKGGSAGSVAELFGQK